MGERVVTGVREAHVHTGEAQPGGGGRRAAGELEPGQRIVCTVTGHGLKDPQWALRTADGGEIEPVKVAPEAFEVAAALGLDG